MSNLPPGTSLLTSRRVDIRTHARHACAAIALFVVAHATPAFAQAKPVPKSAASPATFATTFAGTWNITAWKVAPWIPAAERASVKPNADVLNHKVVFSAARISGPSILSCAKPKYEIHAVPFENLFEGGLKQPATEAPALGFTAPVTTLMPGCDMEYHLSKANTALFALDNVLYTMSRAVTAPK